MDRFLREPLDPNPTGALPDPDRQAQEALTAMLEELASTRDPLTLAVRFEAIETRAAHLADLARQRADEKLR